MQVIINPIVNSKKAKLLLDFILLTFISYTPLLHVHSFEGRIVVHLWTKFAKPNCSLF
ncbi:hypothetical protein RV03_GL003286 [Enterococcus gallinarum]|nr:hypothetical protein RV03_GL003286 [Enterococcus gallinarum]